MNASEVFADRSYQSDGSLTPRSMQGALIENTDDCLSQVLQMIFLSGHGIISPMLTFIPDLLISRFLDEIEKSRELIFHLDF